VARTPYIRHEEREIVESILGEKHATKLYRNTFAGAQPLTNSTRYPNMRIWGHHKLHSDREYLWQTWPGMTCHNSHLLYVAFIYESAVPKRLSFNYALMEYVRRSGHLPDSARRWNLTNQFHGAGTSYYPGLEINTFWFSLALWLHDPPTGCRVPENAKYPGIFLVRKRRRP